MLADILASLRDKILNIIKEGMNKIKSFFREGAAIPKLETCLPFIAYRNFVTDIIDFDLADLPGKIGRGRPKCDPKRLMAMAFYLYGKTDRVREFASDIDSNPLLRYALGFDPDEKPYSIASMYNFMGHLYGYIEREKRNPFSEVFANATKKLASFFGLSGESVRTDSKLFGSNIAYDNRYVIVVLTIQSLCHIGEIDLDALADKEYAKPLRDFVDSTPRQDCYHFSSERISEKMLEVGIVIKALIDDLQQSAPQILRRVFNDQYFLDEEGKVAVRKGEEIAGTSLQSPYDTDCQYVKKYHAVKGYVVNLAENIGELLSLVTSVIVEGACVPDKQFTKACIIDTENCTGQSVRRFYADGAYHDYDTREWFAARDCDYVFTGFKGKPSKYQIRECASGDYQVTNLETGLVQAGYLTAGGAIRILNDGGGKSKYRYFSKKMLECAKARTSQGLISREEKNKRNNVEGTIAEFSSVLDGDKCRYRGMFACRRFGICRAMSMNINRICIFIKENFNSSLQSIAA